MKKYFLPFVFAFAHRSVLFLASALLLCACGAKEKKQDCIVLSVGDSMDKAFPIEDVVEILPMVSIIETDESMLGTIRSVFESGRFLFIIDHTGTISKIDAESGEIVKQKCTVGRGPQEYLDLTSITGDDSFIYILDYQGGNVIKFDHELNFQKRFDAPAGLAIDFIKTDAGLLFSAPFDAPEKRVIVTDDNCVEIAHLAGSQHMTDYLPFAGCFFTKGTDGSIYFHEPFNDEVFRVDGDSLTKFLVLDRPGKAIEPDALTHEIEETGTYISNFFALDGKMLVIGSFDNKPYCALCDGSGDQIIGMQDTTLTRPFIAQHQFGDKCISVVTITDDDGELLDENVQYTYLPFRLKQ